ncbi:MAG: hypothetical protein ACXQTL_04960 [Methanosarcinales archaeon]
MRIRREIYLLSLVRRKIRYFTSKGERTSIAHAVAIPRSVIQDLGWEEVKAVRLWIEDGRIVIEAAEGRKR